MELQQQQQLQGKLLRQLPKGKLRSSCCCFSCNCNWSWELQVGGVAKEATRMPCSLLV